MNPDASRFCAAPGSAAPAPHAPAAPGGSSDSAVRRHVGSGGGHDARTRRRSRSGHGRNGRRSAPGCDSPRTQTAGLTGHRHGPIGKPPVDQRLDCRDTGSACVPSTVWGTASSKTAKFRIGAVLALDTGKLLPRSLRPRQPASRRHPAVKSADPGRPPKSSAAAFNAPDLRGCRPPSTRNRLHGIGARRDSCSAPAKARLPLYRAAGRLS